MADVATSPIELDLNPSVLDHPVSIAVASEAPVYGQIASNQRPAAEILAVTEDQIAVEGNAPFVFRAGSASVTFRKDAVKLCAIFPDPSALKAALADAGDLDLQIPARPNTHYALLRWDYDASASASGAMGLASAGANLSAAGNQTGFYALIREIADGPGSLDILNNLVSSFRTPRQIQTLDDIPPGTWIIAETLGSFALALAASYGLNLNWIRQAASSALQGDLGLTVAPALEARLGLSATGRYGIILSRGLDGPEQQRIRVQVCKMGSSSSEVGMNGGIRVTPANFGAPPNLASLSKAILGLQPDQLLASFDQNAPLVSDIARVFDGAQSRLDELVKLWKQQPQKLSAFVWSKLSDRGEFAKIADFVARISSLSPGDLAYLVQAAISRMSFPGSIEGRTLAGLAWPKALASLESLTDWQALAARLKALSTILNDASLVQILQKLQSQIDQRLDLNQIERAISAADLTQLDPWLLRRLEGFLAGHSSLTVAKLKDLRDQLAKVATLGNSLYSKALDALNRQFNFALTANYQSAGSMTALVDLSLDFSRDASGAERALVLALDGRFDQILLDHNNDAVLVNHAALTEGLRRQSSVELALPFLDATRTHNNDVLASLDVVDQWNGRVFMYNGAASDTISESGQFESTLAVNVIAGGTLGPGVAIHDPPQAACSYSLPMAFRQLTRTHFKSLLGAELEEYFPNLFEREPGGLSIDHWLNGLIGGANENIGNTLISLEVSFPSRYVLSWLKAPVSKSALQYKIMSVMLQRKFRRLLLQQYFSNADRYRDVADDSPVFTLLAFASTPCVTAAALDPGSDHAAFPASNGSSIYWNFEDSELRRAVLAHPATLEVLIEHLKTVRSLLIDAGANTLCAYYADNQAVRIVESAVNSHQIALLFQTEAEIVETARDAGLAIAEFQASEFRNPAQARKALAAFGSKATRAFHNDLQTYATGSAMFPLGGLLFAEAARAFDPSLRPADAQAMFSLTALKPAAPFPPAGFPHNVSIPPNDVLVESRFVNAPRA